MRLGTVVAIWRYPVKSLRGVSLPAAQIDRDGLEGDRTRALLVTGGHARIGKTYRGKEDERLHRLDAPAEACQRARERGIALTTTAPGRYFDDAPISVILTAWLDDASAALGFALEPERFRPNILIEAPLADAPLEAALQGVQLAIGSVRLRVRAPIERCVSVNYAPIAGAPNPAVLRSLAQLRAATLGVYCDVARPGRMSLGDGATIEA